MKILLFEFVTGGGYSGQALPMSLAKEGTMMLQALVKELKLLSHVELVILLDWRFKNLNLTDRADLVVIEKDQHYLPVLQRVWLQCDFFWPIAPETDGILNKLAELSDTANIKTLLSSPAAIRLCTSKFNTFSHLKGYEVDVIDTQYVTGNSVFSGDMTVIKPDDGVGCEQSFIVSSNNEFKQVFGRLENIDRYVMQPYLTGRSLSLSCLFKRGMGWLLCCNEQHVEITGQRLRLTACQVNIQPERIDDYCSLISRIARAIPGLWGYIGIDLIELEQQRLTVLEINPRLTTSYCGIYKATGINVAEQVLNLLNQEPEVNKSMDRIYTVNIAMEKI